jgi:hypothetical protein
VRGAVSRAPGLRAIPLSQKFGDTFDLGRLPLDGEEFSVPYPPDPARLQPFRKLLWLGHVALDVARRLFPFTDGFNTCSCA